MKTFTVQGLGWENNVSIDDSVFEKYEEMAFEAMTQALQNFFDGKAQKLYLKILRFHLVPLSQE